MVYVQPTLSERLWAKVSKTDGCWFWNGAKNGANAYGVVWGGPERRRYLIAHRVAWELEHGPIPQGMRVCHSCDNKLCMRPDHLFLGTDQDNFADMRRKQRHTFGERHPNAKLTEQDVLWIRREYAKPGVTLQHLADALHVSPSLISAVFHRKIWGHLEAQRSSRADKL